MYCKLKVIIFFFIVINNGILRFSLLFATSDVGQTVKEDYNKVVVSPELRKTFGSLVDKAKGAFDGGTNMLKGMGQSFGVVTSDYRYSFRVFNDAPAPVFVAVEQLTGVMGATFSGNINKGLVIGPMADSGNEFYKTQLYITVWVCADKNQKSVKEYSKSSSSWAEKGAIVGAVAGLGVMSPLTTALGAAVGGIAGGIATAEALDNYSIYEKDIYPWSNNDDKIYFYRAYTHKGQVKAEYLDLAKTSSAFSGQFYNSSKEIIPLQFIKDGRSYTVTLEPNTFSLLESSKDVDYSIRPPKDDNTRGFQFYNSSVSDQNKLAFIPIAAEGIAVAVDSRSQEQQQQPLKESDLVAGPPKLYTYEVYDAGQGPAVGVQGLKIGNFDQPLTNIRDINPAVCYLWYKDAATAQSELETKAKEGTEKPDYSNIPFDIPEQVWINYQTDDYVLQEKVVTATVVDFYLLRPQIKEKEAQLYVVSLQTQNDTKAKKFLDRLNAGKIGQKAIFTDVTKEQIDKKTILEMKPNPNGFIKDDQGTDASGVTGAILLTDYFTPQGVGIGPFYYELDPAVLRVDQFANCIWFDKKFYKQDSTGTSIISDDVMKDLSQKLPQWITQYKTNQDGAKTSLKGYLQEKANSGLFVDATKAPAQREFTQQGKDLLQTLIDGPISIKNYPIMRKAGMNWYTRTLGDKPDSWPEKKS